ncbi:antimicrobial peptide system protein, SdpB family [Paenibacillus tianmuensis]|uniref:Antimicrobial peptide system protein, SdpB family n=1 Tax=Paenibacillus tianmuensis TaxID=624147 RepID=A0A1G4TZU2_9BACL|nr:sporulation-delaying protein SdpB family protein [Paenibacillus tianmuensis]SCW86916.1 antimicrobial peptide system protein, SdpB family [Paenibacillus tianmuensis]
MLSKLGAYAHGLARNTDPWTNVYGLARTLIALASALTLSINDARVFFRPYSGSLTYPNCEGTLSLFCTVPNDYTYLNLLRWLCVIGLLVIASGWRPRITGILHFWIAYSFNVSALTLDGGEQVTTVLTFLLLPITLTDPRKWHWQKSKPIDPLSDAWVTKRLIAIVTFHAIRFQVAILYFHSTIAKLFEPTWLDGTAVYYYLTDPMLGLPPFFLKLVDPILTSPAVVIPTWGTLLLQSSLFGALFSPKKHWKFYLTAALLLHELIAIMLGLISFSMIMSAALILYLVPFEHQLRLFKSFKFSFKQTPDLEQELAGSGKGVSTMQ